MPVRLDQVPPQALRPERPRAWLWFGLLLLFLLLGVGFTLLFGTQALREQPADFWRWALGLPLLGWCVLGFGRGLVYVTVSSAADGWDEAREEDLISKRRRGRRSQQVLSVSLHTALREPRAQPTMQLDALLKGTVALKSQSSRLGAETSLHSRLAGDANEDPERALLRVLAEVLADLAQTLAGLPDDKPLALLLEVDSRLEESQWRPLWQQAWAESGIRQSIVPLEGSGLAAVDQWLDQRINDQALLLVVSVQIAPEQPDGKAEAAVGLLFGNRLTQTTLLPLAYLHRPEQEREATHEDLIYAARQALDWVWEPLDASAINRVWRAGIDRERDAALSMAVGEVSLPTTLNDGVCNLDALLGHPGRAAPWLAIAAATQAVQGRVGPQFIFSGGSSVDAGLWCTVLIPVPTSTQKT